MKIQDIYNQFSYSLSPQFKIKISQNSKYTLNTSTDHDIIILKLLFIENSVCMLEFMDIHDYEYSDIDVLIQYTKIKEILNELIIPHYYIIVDESYIPYSDTVYGVISGVMNEDDFIQFAKREPEMYESDSMYTEDLSGNEFIFDKNTYYGYYSEYDENIKFKYIEIIRDIREYSEFRKNIKTLF